MAKYLAVIKDSFREAVASRVLWLVMVLITLLLLALAPLGYREELTWRLGDSDVREWPDLMELVRTEGDEGTHKPAGRIWELLDSKLRNRLTKVKIPGKDEDVANPFEFMGVFGDFRKAVNEMLGRRDFFDEQAFQEVAMLSNELRALRNEGLDQLSETSVKRFNRLLLEAAFPDLVRGSAPTSIQLLYGWLKLGPSFPLRGETLKESVQSMATTGLDWFVGAIGVCVAILVTAPIIPQMFDPGALHLLLSKPLSRSWLFLAKFFGGCAFIFIGAAYLIGGLWLILGIRFEIWDPSLLWSIPIYLFVFSVYYSVSAFVGVVWRSPIVSIGLTVLFWLTCFLIGTSKAAFETAYWSKARLTKLIWADDALLSVNEMGILHEWNEASREWEEAFVSAEQRESRGLLLVLPTIPRELRPVGPIYDPGNSRLVSVQPTLQRELKLYMGEKSSGWEAVSEVSPPTGTMSLFHEPTGSILAVSSMGIFRLRDGPLTKQQPPKFLEWLPLDNLLPKSRFNLGGAFDDVSPDPPVLLTQPAAVAMHPQSGELCVYTRGTLTRLQRDERGRFELAVQVDLEGGERQPVVLAMSGEDVVVGRENGTLQIRDVKTLELKSERQPSGSNPPRFIAASPDGQLFVLVLHNGELWCYDAKTGDLTLPRVSGQGDISAATFVDNQSLLVADQTLRVTQYELASFDVMERYRPKLELLAAGYRYVLAPLYLVFPKPGELDKTIQFLLSGKQTERLQHDDLSAAQQEVDAWTPLWSSALFMLTVLALACVYIERQDF